MSKKLFVLVSTLVGCAGTASSAVIAYIDCSYAPALIASIGIGVTAVTDILAKFVKE